MFKLEIDTGNLAFCNLKGDPDQFFEAMELVRIIKTVIEDLDKGSLGEDLYDCYGNRVGSWSR